MADSNPTNPLHRIAPEIRDLIYEYSFGPSINHISRRLPTRPTLLEAVRSDPQLYEEALAVFYKTNVFVLNNRSCYAFGALNIKTLKSIQRLSVDLEYTTIENEHTRLFENVVSAIRTRMMDLGNVVYLEIGVHHQDASHPVFLKLFGNNGIETWTRLTRLEICIRGEYTAGAIKDKYHYNACRLVKMVEEMFGPSSSGWQEGAQGVCRNLPYPFWSAAKGSTLFSDRLKEGASTRLPVHVNK